jgi:hypothetical protein
MKPSPLKRILFTGLIAFNGLALGTAWAQVSEAELQQNYENALLDSLIGYELLKPIHYTLTKTNEFLNKDNLALRAENSLLHMQLKMQQEQIEGLLEAERKKHRKRVAAAFGLGFVLGKLTPPY